jgi:hypothetical protein
VAAARRKRKVKAKKPPSEWIWLDEAIDLLNEAGIATYGPWPHGFEREEALHVQPVDAEGHAELDQIRVNNTEDGTVVMRRQDVMDYIESHARPTVVAEEVVVVDAFAGRMRLEEAISRTRAYGGDANYHADQTGREQLTISICYTDQWGTQRCMIVGNVQVDRIDGVPVVDAYALESVLAKLSSPAQTG